MLPIFDVRDLDDIGRLKLGSARLYAIAAGRLNPDAMIFAIDECVGIVETYDESGDADD